MLIDPNFSDALGEMVEGNQVCKILSVEGKLSQAGNKYLNWKLESKDGRTVYYTTMVEGKAAGMLKHFIRCVSNPTYEGGRFDTNDLVGKSVTVNLGIKEFEGKNGPAKGYVVKEVFKNEVYSEPNQFSEQDIPF